MDLFGAKVKLILLLLCCFCVLVAAYWLYIKQKPPVLSVEKTRFVPPRENITKHVLPNGMHVVLYKNDVLPKVLVQIAYNVGSAEEESGERGLAHLVEHMIFKGTDKLSESDLDAIARKFGASYNAYTSYDITSYYFETNKNNWRPFLDILADCMQNVRFEPEHLASEVKAVVQELNMGKDQYWRSLCYKGLELLFAANHPYHTPVIGYKEDLLTLTADRVKAFYKRHYTPDRATLFVAGDIDPTEMMATIEKQFSTIPASNSLPARAFPGPGAEICAQHVRFYEDVNSDHLLLCWPVPGYKKDQQHISEMLEGLLGMGQASILNRVLVDQHKVAASAGAQNWTLMEGGMFCIIVEPLAGKAERCVELVQEILKNLAINGAPAVDIERIAKIKMVSFFNQMIDYRSLVGDWIYSYFATGDEMHLFDSVDRFNTITSEDVKTFAKEYLDSFVMQRLEVLPLPAEQKARKEALKQAADELDRQILAKHQRTAPQEAVRAALDYQAPAQLEFTLPKPERVVQLPNGLTVILTPQHHVPLVSLGCFFKEASYLGDAREGVLVDLMMSLLLEGSKEFTKEENVNFFEQRGASYSFESGGAAMSCLASDFTQLTERFVHILQFPTFAQDALEKIRKVAIENCARSKDSAKDVAFRLLKSALFKGHPYAWTFDEAIADLSAATTSSLCALHKKLLTGGNMVLSVTGDFNVDEMEKVVRRYFEPLPVGEQSLVLPPQPEMHDEEQLTAELMRDQVFLVYGKKAQVTVHDPDYLPLRLLTTISFYSLGSRLFELRERTGLFYTAFGELAGKTGKQPGFDYVGMIVNPENLEKAEQGVYDCLAKIAEQGVTEAELAGAKQLYESGLVDMLGNNGKVCSLFNRLHSLGLPYDYYENSLQRVHAITVEELNAVAARYVSKDGFVRVRVGRV
jgi:zinc protease